MWRDDCYVARFQVLTAVLLKFKSSGMWRHLCGCVLGSEDEGSTSFEMLATVHPKTASHVRRPAQA